jgi:hypothetical protein
MSLWDWGRALDGVLIFPECQRHSGKISFLLFKLGDGARDNLMVDKALEVLPGELDEEFAFGVGGDAVFVEDEREAVFRYQELFVGVVGEKIDGFAGTVFALFADPGKDEDIEDIAFGGGRSKDIFEGELFGFAIDEGDIDRVCPGVGVSSTGVFVFVDEDTNKGGG